MSRDTRLSLGFSSPVENVFTTCIRVIGYGLNIICVISIIHVFSNIFGIYMVNLDMLSNISGQQNVVLSKS